MIDLKSFQRKQELATPDLLPYGLMIDEGIIMNKDGSYMSSWYYRAKDDNSMTALDRNHANDRLNTALSRLGSGWCMHVNAIRTKSDIYPAKESSHFPDKISSLIEAERREFFEGDGNSFESHFTISLTFTPEPVAQKKLESMFFEVEGKEGKVKQLGDKTLGDFKKAIKDFDENISLVLNLTRMMPYAEKVDGVEYQFDEQLSLLDYLFHQEEMRKVRIPDCGMFLDSFIGRYPFATGVVPKIGDNFIAVIAIDGLPQQTYAGIMNSLAELSIEYRWSSRFIPLDAHQAKAQISSFTRKWNQKVKGFIASMTDKADAKIDQNSLSMRDDAQMAEAEASGDAVSFGYYTGNLIILNKDPEYLEKINAALRKSLLRIGMNSSRIEDINTVEAWLGSMPANSYSNVRKPLIHTLNLSDMMPTSSVYAGEEKNPSDLYPDNSPPLAMVKTSGSTPFRLNLHVNDLGHTMILGPTGSGKSTLLTFLESQMLRYKNVKIFAFDKGNSMYAINQGVGGNHYNIGGETEDGLPSMAFAPLSKIDSEADFIWACEWVATLIEMQFKAENKGVSVEHKIAIRDAMNQHRDSDYKTLGDFRSQVQNQEIKDALTFYTELPIYNAPHDELRDGHFECFEIEELMNFKDEISLPILLYIFRCIEKRIDGKPGFIVIDEAWLVLAHPVFAEKVKEWLKVLRKGNFSLILATQSLVDAIQSPIFPTLMESCKTKIFLANEYANDQEFKAAYVKFGLNNAQRNIIANARVRREYFITSPSGDRLIDLALGDVALAFCAKSSKDDLAAIRDHQKKHADNWTYEWIKTNLK